MDTAISQQLSLADGDEQDDDAPSTAVVQDADASQQPLSEQADSHDTHPRGETDPATQDENVAEQNVDGDQQSDDDDDGEESEYDSAPEEPEEFADPDTSVDIAYDRTDSIRIQTQTSHEPSLSKATSVNAANDDDDDDDSQAGGKAGSKKRMSITLCGSSSLMKIGHPMPWTARAYCTNSHSYFLGLSKKQRELLK